MKVVKATVQRYGLQLLFYLSGSDNTMKSLVDEPHPFILAEVVTEYESRITDEPSPIKDKDEDNRLSSIIDRVKCYDEYKLYELAL